MVRNAELVLPHLTVFIGGWPVHFAGRAADCPTPPDIDLVEREDGGVTVLLNGRCGYSLSFDDEFNAANGLASALIAAYVTRRPEMVCLHASSAAVGAGDDAAIAVMLGESFAGKSSTALQMAAAGHRLFGDDRLAVVADDEGAGRKPVRGICMGLMPKIRLPLPPDCGPRFQEFVERCSEICDDRAGSCCRFGCFSPFCWSWGWIRALCPNCCERRSPVCAAARCARSSPSSGCCFPMSRL